MSLMGKFALCFAAVIWLATAAVFFLNIYEELLGIEDNPRMAQVKAFFLALLFPTFVVWILVYVEWEGIKKKFSRRFKR